MGDTIQQWRATIGLWSGGRPRNCVILQHHIAQTSDDNGYKYVRFLVLASLLIIGCVELNPGPKQETDAKPQTAGALRKFDRRRGTDGLHGEMYGIKTAAFLFARGLNRTEDFQLASNVDGAGAFDDLVFRYRLKQPDVWKTCFIQLKHKKRGGTIQRSSLTQVSGDFSLLKYFMSYCEIKNNAVEHSKLQHCGLFDEFEFVIYTNYKLETTHSFQGRESDPLSILSSGTDNREYKTFDETSDNDIFGYFELLSQYHKLVVKLDSLLKSTASVGKEIDETIQELQNFEPKTRILKNLNILQSTANTDYVKTQIEKLAKCDFSLFQEFLKKVKIFHSQSNETSLRGLIEKELQGACKASPTFGKFVYTKYQDGFYKWWGRDRKVVWLNEDSELWQTIQKDIINEVTGISYPDIQEIKGFDIHFNQQQLQKLSHAIKQNTVLNIVTNSNFCTLHKLKIYQALNILGYENSLFIGIKFLKDKHKEIKNLWPCKWSDVLVVHCDSDDNVARKLLDILQHSADCVQELDNSDDNAAETLVQVLEQYQQKLILISPLQQTSSLKEKLRNVYHFEDNCDILDLDENSQKQILERSVNFQGTSVPLSTLVGKDPPESIKSLLDSDVISSLLSNKLNVGRQLSDHCNYYVPRLLQHQIYLKEDILKLTEKSVTFAVSGLELDELKNYLPAGDKIHEFVYDERRRNHTLRIVSDFSKIGTSDESESLTTNQKVGQNVKSNKVTSNTFENKDTGSDDSDKSNISAFRNVAKFPKSGRSVELENMEAHNLAVQNIKPEEVTYIIFGNKNPESEFEELKKLCRNVHWIHVEGGSFLWRDTNCNIDIIRRYVDDTKYQKYDMKCVVEHNDRTMLLVADPGMGKSTFLSYMAHEIKKLKPSVWVLKINLKEYTNELEDTDLKQECIEKCKEFLWRAAHSPEQNALKITKEIFLQALRQAGKMVIILDGFDEISPDYSDEVKMLITAIRDETASKIWISSRFYCRQELEDILGKFALTLQPFTSENQTQFLVKYWSEVAEIPNTINLQTFAEKVLSLCSQNFSDKERAFTSIPLQTMMLGEAFVNEVNQEHCCSGEFNLPEKFNVLSLFKKFTENKFHIYFKEKCEMDPSKPEAKGYKKDYVEKHMISALMYLLSQKEFNEIRGAIKSSKLEETKWFLLEGKAQKIGIITDVMNGNPHFIHRSFAEYYAAKWFAENFKMCQDFISEKFFNSTYEVTRNMFDRMHAENSEIHGAILHNVKAIDEFLKQESDINMSDKGGRTALHLAASYNSQYIQQLLTVPGIDANIPDAVLKWTPLRYAERTKSWMAMDILLQNGANPNDIVFTRTNAEDQEWGQAAVWECASKGHIKLLEFMLNCGIEVNECVDVPQNFHEKRTILHKSSHCAQVEVVEFLVNRGADINICDANNNTALHIAAESGSVNIIKLFLVKGISVNLTNSNGSTPLHVSVRCGNLEATKTLVEKGAAINTINKYGDTPLTLAAYYCKLELFRYLTDNGADINIPDAYNNTVLHKAAKSGSVDIIKLLLNKRVSVNLTNSKGSTPLHVSAECGNLETTKALVEGSAAINSTNKFGDTPLMRAAYFGKLETFRYLTDKGADINIANFSKNTTLHCASASVSFDIVKLLLDKGMSVNLKNSEGFTPLHFAIKFAHTEPTKCFVEKGAAVNHTTKYGTTPLTRPGGSDQLKTFHYLTENGANINIRVAKKKTALHMAAESGSVDIINLLLDKEMPVNLTSSNGSTPLHVSAEFGNLEATIALVERGAGINNTNKYGDTPLMRAAYHGKLEIFRYLTETGADINIRDAAKNTTLHSAAESGSVDIIRIILNKEMSVDAPNINGYTQPNNSAQFGQLGPMNSLVERGAAINITNKHGQTPLMRAAYYGRLETFRCLIERGADINIRDTSGNTALHIAARSVSVNNIKLLLDKGISVNLANSKGSTPLHVSAQFGNLEATKALVERGAAVNNTNKFGDTPLMRAAYYGELEVVRYLTENGADINITDKNDKNTALHKAAKSGSVDIINLLLDNGMSANLTNSNNSTPLHVSAQFGHLEATIALVERGAGIKNINNYRLTPLTLAKISGNLEIVRYLTEFDGVVNIGDA